MSRLRNKLVLAFAAVVLGSVAVLMYAVCSTTWNAFSRHLRMDVARSYRPFENMQNPLMKQLADKLDLLANDPALQELRQRKEIASLQDQAEEIMHQGRVDLLVMADIQGKVLVSLGQTNVPRDLSTVPLMQQVLREGAHINSYILFNQSQLYVAAAGPLLKGDYTDGAALVGQRVDNKFCQSVSKALSIPDNCLIMVGVHGQVIAGFQQQREFSLQDPHAADMNKYLGTWQSPHVVPPWKLQPGQAPSETAPLGIGLAARQYIALPYPLWDAVSSQPLAWLFIMEPQDELLALVSSLIRVILITALASLVAALLVSAWLSGRITRPIEVLADKMLLVGEGDLQEHVQVVGHDEVARLSTSFNEMVNGLRQKELLKRYVPLSALGNIEKADVHLGGIRIRVAVLISDLRGFTPLSEKLDPTELVALLNEYLECMTRVILQHQGDVLGFLGDGILAVFHDPKVGPNMCSSLAVRAAIDMQQELADLQRRSTNPHIQALRMGIGVNTGIVVEGNIGTQDRLQHTVIGDTVNSAARIQDRSRDGKHTCILISEGTYNDVKDEVHTEFFANESLKGKSAPVALWEVTMRKPPETPAR